jgi:hypothetical protein
MQKPLVLFPLFLLFACGPMTEKKNAPGIHDPVRTDTLKKLSPPENATAADSIVHLKDTAKVEANCVVFLRPDKPRFDDYARDPALHIYEADADFADGLTGTLNAFEKEKKYDDINGEIVTERFVVIEGCADGPLLIDRDSVDYGLILVGKGRQTLLLYNNIHSGDYLQDVDKYFGIKK